MSLTRSRDTEELGPFRPAVAIRSPITCDITIISLGISTVTGLAYTEAPSYMYMPANVLHLVRAVLISESAFQTPLLKLFTCSRMKLLQALHILVKRLKECLKLYILDHTTIVQTHLYPFVFHKQVKRKS